MRDAGRCSSGIGPERFREVQVPCLAEIQRYTLIDVHMYISTKGGKARWVSTNISGTGHLKFRASDADRAPYSV